LFQGIGVTLIVLLALADLTETLPDPHRGRAVDRMAIGTTLTTTITPLLIEFSCHPRAGVGCSGQISWSAC
jgi:hypothetical protein